MLVGRRPEQTRIVELLSGARRGKSGGLLLRGEAGIGKSALLEFARGRARGMTVLHVRGAESERELPFAALAELIAPIVDRIEAVPTRQADALRAALALGSEARGERFAVFTATLSLLAAAAEDTPQLLLVDDAHWLDEASAGAVAFVARRLEAEGIALLLAARLDEIDAFRGVVPEIVVGGLDAAAGRDLLSARGHDLPDDIVSRLVEATGGNPLAMLETAGSAAELELAEGGSIPVLLPEGSVIERAFSRRVASLPEPTRRALALLAIGERESPATLDAALVAVGLSVRDLEPAEAIGVIRLVGGALAFTHPLTRAAAYNAVTAAARRDAHRALARELPAAAQAARAWHLAAAAIGPDAEAATALEGAANAARHRGGTVEAASAFARAATLEPDAGRRLRLLREAAVDFQAVGKLDRSLQLLDEALRLCDDDPSLRAELQHLRGRALMWVGSPAETLALWLDEAARVETADPARAASMYAEAGIIATMTGDVHDIVDICERAVALAGRVGSIAELGATAVLSNGLILQGRARKALPMLERCREAFESADPLAAHAVLVQPIGHGGIWLERYDEARQVLERVIGAARASSAGGLLPFPLACLSELEFRTGRWTSAYANAAESVRLADELGQANELCFSLVNLAAVEAGQGRDVECRAHVERARAGALELGAGSVVVYCGWVLGLLELGLGRLQAACDELERLAALVESYALREPGVVWWRADFIETLIRLKRTDDAERQLVQLEREARVTGRAWAHVAAARCRGLLAPAADVEQIFTRALHRHRTLDAPFERARTELCLGERRRRGRHRQAAREALEAALETFERLGAAPWAEHARAELRACGVKSESDPERKEALTPQELQVALLVARGATNREAAAALFVSPKTIEFHLANVYRKLGLGSRTQLVRALLVDEGVASSDP